MKQFPLFLLLGLTGCLTSGCFNQNAMNGPLVLNGNIDDRQVNVSFLVSERIESVFHEEGAVVKKGDLLATLETVRIQNRIDEAQAALEAANANVAATQAAVAAAQADLAAAQAGVEAAQATLDKAVNGNRAEDIAISEAALEVVNAQIKAAANLYERNQKLTQDKTNQAVSEQELENAESNFKKIVAQQKLAQANLEKMKNGSRKEDIEAARAALAQAKALQQKAEVAIAQTQAEQDRARAAFAQAQATVAIQKQTLADCRLLAPTDGIVRSRILEPGEMSAPQSPVLSIAVVSPKWVRVYLNETLLPRVKPGDKATIRLDGLTDTLEGWVGYISPTAEFTPKSVQTPELRTSLVYEVRVYVKDPDNFLKLGAPATVEIQAAQPVKHAQRVGE